MTLRTIAVNEFDPIAQATATSTGCSPGPDWTTGPERPQFAAPVKYGSLALSSRYLLSPLAGFTNLSFRRIVRSLGGVGLCTTDLVHARGLLEGSPRTVELTETCPEDTPLSVQIFGSNSHELARAAQLLEQRGVQSVDINMGCPVQHVTRVGAGASLMCQPDSTIRLVEQVVRAVRIPVTVKMRLGWDAQQITAPEFARAFEQVGVAAVAIHGRTREQGFRGSVSREGIARVVAAVKQIPVIGNGDIRTVADADRMFRETGCHGISVGRGALANPWIFQQLQAWELTGAYPPAGSFSARMELLRRQFGYMLGQRGIERGLPGFRKMAHWYLSAMRVTAKQRNAFQMAQTIPEVEAILARIAERGPYDGRREGPLPDWSIPVPSGPVERW